MLVTHSGDYFTVDRMAEALLKRGAKVFRLDTDLFPEIVSLTAEIDNRHNTYKIEYGDSCISSEQIRAVWMRRIWRPQLSKELTPQFRAFCTKESSAMLDDFWNSLRQARWVDNLTQIRRGENKMRQLRIACEVGLTVPRTLITNKPDEVKQFFYQVQGKMITKLIRPLSASMTGNSIFFYTSKVAEKDLDDLDSLIHSPMIFQEQIPKAEELRIVFVDGNVFVGSLSASEYETSTLDWRQASSSTCSWQFYLLPQNIVNRLNAFMARFKLIFGVFDFIKTPDGEYVFLEINPVGEWGMLERDLGLPIAEAIANVLLT